MKQVLMRVLRHRWFLSATGLLVVYALIGFLLLPWLVQRYVPEYARDTLKRQASIGKVRINPFLLTFEAKDFRLAEADGTPILGVQRLYVDLQTESLFRWAWVFAVIDIDGLDLRVVTHADGRVNLAELAAAARGEKPAAPAKDEAPVRMLLRHVALSEGRLTYTDRSGPAPASATLEPINLEFDDVSTLPERKGPYTVSARLPGGGNVRWRGEVSLRPIASEGVLSIAKFRPASVWKFVQDQFRLDPPAGEVDFVTNYRFLFAGGKPQLMLSGANLGVAGLELRQPGAAEPLLVLQQVQASDVGLDLQRREITVPKLAISNGRVAAAVDPDGNVDWQTIPIAKGSTGPAGAPWTVRLDGIHVGDVALHVIDSSRAMPLALDVGNVAIDAKALLGTGAATTVSSDALRIDLSKVTFTPPGAATPLLALDSATLEGDSIDTAKRQARLKEIVLRGGGTRLVRDAKGRIELLDALAPSSRGAARKALEEAAKAAQAEGAPWQFRLGALRLEGFGLALADESFAPPLRYDLADVSATLQNLSNDGKSPVEFDAALRVAQGGSAAAAGSLAPDGSAADARVKINRINLAPLQPALARYAELVLKAGDLSASATLRYEKKKSGAALRASGALGITGLAIDEAQSGERFLGWKSLSATGIRFSLAPDRLGVAEVRLVEPQAKITIFKDRSVNLATVLKKQAPASPAAPAQAGAFPVSVERVRLENGTVDFADQSLALPFAAHVRELGGVIAGISSDPASRAELELEGRVDEQGLARAKGAFSPFAPKRFLDLRLEFRNVELTPFSPYSATFAGRKIASGRLTTNLEYKIRDGQLEGDNKILLDKFTLGERVESPSALHLPLDLAIALLTDADGKIDVAVPVRGDVNNPKFSYGHLIWQAIVTVIKNIVTAPFRALGALLGGGAAQLDAVAFDAGSDRVLPTELDKLKKVAEALQKRPQLKVIVDGRYNTAVDGAALRADKVRRELAAAQDVKLAPGEMPGPVAFDSAKTQRALEKLLTARSGERAVADFQAQFEKRTGREAKRVNPALAFFGKGSSDSEFYEAMYKRLVELHPLAPNELEALGQSRADAVAQALVKDAHVDASRVAPGKTEATGEAPKDTVETKLRLDVMGAKP
ncbi:MAG TPA: DUF748 domain-containing protein [Burkholderiales bacterium]|nr:DUF748 domain-containing protein [Burkholderiales bacterium]